MDAVQLKNEELSIITNLPIIQSSIGTYQTQYL